MKPRLKLGRYGCGASLESIADRPLQLKRNEKYGTYYWEFAKKGVLHWWWTNCLNETGSNMKLSNNRCTPETAGNAGTVTGEIH